MRGSLTGSRRPPENVFALSERDEDRAKSRLLNRTSECMQNSLAVIANTRGCGYESSRTSHRAHHGERGALFICGARASSRANLGFLARSLRRRHGGGCRKLKKGADNGCQTGLLSRPSTCRAPRQPCSNWIGCTVLKMRLGRFFVGRCAGWPLMPTDASTPAPLLRPTSAARAWATWRSRI